MRAQVRQSSQMTVSWESELSRRVIKTSAPQGSHIRSLVVFPQADELANFSIPHHMQCVALLRLKNHTVWMLSVPGETWTEDRLEVAAKALLAVSADAYTKSTIERLLREKLRNEAVRVEWPVTDRVDLRQWEVQKTSFHLAKRLSSDKSRIPVRGSDSRLRYSDIEKVLIDALEDALQEFVDELDATALNLSSTQGRVNHRLYKRSLAM